mmetsp:Transcript_65174/g.194304  ORF Transcript_65174/g.194304 Transcript_65174/m.194304 type:complete len:333 (-) Transcript_65174:494-1492(-)
MRGAGVRDLLLAWRLDGGLPLRAWRRLRRLSEAEQGALGRAARVGGQQDRDSHLHSSREVVAAGPRPRHKRLEHGRLADVVCVRAIRLPGGGQGLVSAEQPPAVPCLHRPAAGDRRVQRGVHRRSALRASGGVLGAHRCDPEARRCRRAAGARAEPGHRGRPPRAREPPHLRACRGGERAVHALAAGPRPPGAHHARAGARGISSPALQLPRHWRAPVGDRHRPSRGAPTLRGGHALGRGERSTGAAGGAPLCGSPRRRLRYVGVRGPGLPSQGHLAGAPAQTRVGKRPGCLLRAGGGRSACLPAVRRLAARPRKRRRQRHCGRAAGRGAAG